MKRIVSSNIIYVCLRVALAIAYVPLGMVAYGAEFNEFMHTYTNAASVGTVFVSSDGTAWVGTSHGLMQYDDLRREDDIRLSMPEALRVPIHMIYGMNDGRMVIVTRSMQKYIFDPDAFGVVEIDREWLASKGISDPKPWDINIISNPHGDLLIESQGKVFVLGPRDSDKAKLVIYLDSPAMALSADDRFYHIVTKRCVYSYHTVTGEVSRVSVPEDLFAPHVVKDGKGNLWLGDRNLYMYSAGGNGWAKLKENAFVSDIGVSDMDIYVGTSASGILRYSDDGLPVGELRNDPHDINSLASDHCATVYVDGKGNLWVTYSKGDLSISTPDFGLIKGLHIRKLFDRHIKDDVISVLPNGQRSIWLGTDGHGLHLVDVESGKEMKTIGMNELGIDDAVITALFRDSKQRLWIGSYRSGLICVDGPRKRRFLANTSPYSIFEDASGNIFVGTSGNGLYRLRAEADDVPLKIDLDGEEWIQKLASGKDGKLLIATASCLMRLDLNTLEWSTVISGYEDDGRLSSFNMVSFYPDSRSLVWMIGEDADDALRIYDTVNDSVYVIPSLSGVRFKSVIEDNGKNMWLTSDNDIYNIVPQYDPAVKGYVFRHYLYHIRSNEKSADKYNNRSVARFGDGRIVFGGMNGYRLIDPAKYQALGQRADVKGRFSALKVENAFVFPGRDIDGRRILSASMEKTDRISLKSNQNSINLLFSPRDYDSPLTVEYYYRIDSSSSDWHPIHANSIDLVNLSPGKYRLEVSAMLPEGVLSEVVDYVDIDVDFPWYRSVWAYMAYVVLAMAVSAVLLYYFSDRQRQRLRVAQAEKEIIRQKQLNDMKVRFFTNISHDFRTPLTLIITPLESFINSHADDEASRWLRPVHKNAVKLLNLVNQILDFRKLDVTGMPLHLSYGDIVDYVREISNSFRLFSEDSGISLDVVADLDSINMYFDKDKLNKIMMNLLSNAFKFTGSGRSVVVKVKRKSENVDISVADTGTGIPDEDKARVFDRFYQASNGLHSSMGCGIGLHIVKEFVELHGGSIRVDDNVPSGSIFTVSIPYRQTVDSDQNVNPEVARGVSDMPLEIPAQTVADAGERPTLLLVEDNRDFIDFMESSLSCDYNVLKAYDGKMALDMLESENVDMIISDVMMDKLDGLQLCKAVKSDLRISHIPVILLTARSLADDEVKGLEAGADDYITKPFNMAVLRQKIAKFIDECRRQRDRFRRIPDIAPSEITITPLDEKFLEKTIKIVEDNMSDPDFSVGTLSSLLGMHRTNLYKKLLGITGKTPVEFIRLIRLKRAAQYLAQSQMYISEIAYKVGFSNPRLLSKYFKEEYDMTPREYVKALGGTLDSDDSKE